MKKNVNYINPKQILFIKAPQKTKVSVMGRGFGKSYQSGLQHGVRAGGLWEGKTQLFKPLARAKVGLFGPTYEHLKNRVVPSMMQGIRKMGFIEHKEGQQNGHYVKFRKPPAYFQEPYEKPEDYSNIITFQNGYTIQLFSWHSADLIRGINLDGADIDEAALLDKEIFDTVIFPTIRGNTYRFLNNPLHQQICFYTSMPWLSSGQWILGYEKLAKENPNDIFFLKGTSWDNMAVLGRDTITRWQREMNPLMYKVEIMCEEVGRISDCYYDEFDERKHCYVDVHHTTIAPDKELFISFDFGGSFSCCVVGQHLGDTIYIHSELFVKGTKLLDNLVDMFCNEFEKHPTKHLKIYGDKQGNSKSLTYLSADFISFYDKLIYEFKQRGWTSELVKLGLNPQYIQRHQVINKALKGDATNNKLPSIKINKAGCTYLPLCLIKAPMKSGYEKDKSSEKDGSTPPEQSTHLTDAFDYVVYRICEQPLAIRKAHKRGKLI